MCLSNSVSGDWVERWLCNAEVFSAIGCSAFSHTHMDGGECSVYVVEL